MRNSTSKEKLVRVTKGEDSALGVAIEIVKTLNKGKTHEIVYDVAWSGEQSEDKSTNKPDGPEPHSGLLYCYEGTNITGERVVNHPRTQLNDALIESCTADFI